MATTYEILDPNQLPPGIVFDGVNTISGTTTLVGQFSFDVKKLIDGVPQYTFSVDFYVVQPPTTPPATTPPATTPPISITSTSSSSSSKSSDSTENIFTTPPATTPP